MKNKEANPIYHKLPQKRRKVNIYSDLSLFVYIHIIVFRFTSKMENAWKIPDIPKTICIRGIVPQ